MMKNTRYNPKKEKTFERLLLAQKWLDAAKGAFAVGAIACVVGAFVSKDYKAEFLTAAVGSAGFCYFAIRPSREISTKLTARYREALANETYQKPEETGVYDLTVEDLANQQTPPTIH